MAVTIKRSDLKHDQDSEFLIDKFIELADPNVLESLHHRVEITSYMDGHVPRVRVGLANLLNGLWCRVSRFNRYHIEDAVEEAARLSEKANWQDQQEAAIEEGLELLEKAGFNTNHSPGTREARVEGTRWPRSLRVELCYDRYDGQFDFFDQGKLAFAAGVLPVLPPEQFCEMLVYIRDKFMESLPETANTPTEPEAG